MEENQKTTEHPTEKPAKKEQSALVDPLYRHHRHLSRPPRPDHREPGPAEDHRRLRHHCHGGGWIATAYILANAIFVPIWGKLGDSIGRKKVYMLGFGIFIVGSVLAGLAWNLPSMIVFRVIQAIAGSADYPTAMAILAVTFKEGKERAQALGIWSSSFAAASVFGPLLGGPLIDGFGWRSVFLINLPIGIIGMLHRHALHQRIALRDQDQILRLVGRHHSRHRPVFARLGARQGP
ncbi:MAG: MFS transporter [bacterium]